MPLYDFKCLRCKLEFEEFVHLVNKDTHVCICGGKAKTLISVRAKPIYHSYYCKYSRCYFTGPKDREKKLRAKGLAIAG